MNIRLKTRKARYGVSVPENKYTAGSPIEPLPLPEKVTICLHQSLGAPCTALVRQGDSVLTGQKIGDSDSFVSAPVHATVSGTVSAVTSLVNPPTGQLISALVITSDGKDEWIKLDFPKDPEALSVEEILARIKEAGIVGLGGATFPTHVKLAPSENRKVDTVILNGCECEPYITSDHRLMLEYTEEMLSGLNIIRRVLSPDNTYIAIEDNKIDAIEHLEKLITEKGFGDEIKIVPLKSKYPMGAEKILTNIILSREVPIGGLPLDIGVIVHNVSTAKAIHDAVCEGKPFIERVVTVTNAVKTPKNLLVRLGTPLSNLIEYCGGLNADVGEVILGGPMMGTSQPSLDFPVTKGTNCILLAESQPIKEYDCIRCGRCLNACPMYLAPTTIVKYSKAGRYEECKKAYIDDCFECGACAYACPSNIPLVQYIKIAKKEISKRTTNQ